MTSGVRTRFFSVWNLAGAAPDAVALAVIGRCHGDGMACAGAAGGAAVVRGGAQAPDLPQPVRGPRPGRGEARGWHREEAWLRQPWTGEFSNLNFR